MITYKHYQRYYPSRREVHKIPCSPTQSSFAYVAIYIMKLVSLDNGIWIAHNLGGEGSGIIFLRILVSPGMGGRSQQDAEKIKK
jgi:hypothetical protein